MCSIHLTGVTINLKKSSLIYLFIFKGEERLNVVDLSNPSDPIMLYRKQFVKMDPTDVEYCGNHVFVSVANDEKPEDGKVLVFRKYNRRHNTMPIVLEVVGMVINNRHIKTLTPENILENL